MDLVCAPQTSCRHRTIRAKTQGSTPVVAAPSIDANTASSGSKFPAAAAAAAAMQGRKTDPAATPPLSRDNNNSSSTFRNMVNSLTTTFSEATMHQSTEDSDANTVVTSMQDASPSSSRSAPSPRYDLTALNLQGCSQAMSTAFRRMKAENRVHDSRAMSIV